AGPPYRWGIWAGGPGPGQPSRHAPAKPDVIAKVERVAAVCKRHDVPLAAAALQFPLGHPAVVSVIPGPVTPEEVRQNLAWLSRDMPGALWTDLKEEGLIVSDAPIKP